MQKVINETHIEGLLYEHTLELKVTGEKSKNPGTQYITGTINIATDDACLNIVPVHFTYVTPTTSNGKENATFTTLKNIIDKVYHTYVNDGADRATKLRVDSAIGLNEFYSERNGTSELVSAKRNEGGFVHMTETLDPDENKRNTFKADMIITSCIEVEGDPAKIVENPDKVIVKGAIFNFRNELLPVEFTATSKGAMDYYMGLNASQGEPVFTRVWGRQISQTVVKTTTEESAFGEASVKESRSTRKDFVITGGARETYEWDTEDTMTAEELTKMVAARETYLATMKQRQDEYKASKANENNFEAAPASKPQFDF